VFQTPLPTSCKSTITSPMNNS